MLSDLRESGAIEQDADIVLFLYRDDYYNEDSEKHNIAECIVAKNRHGETGKVELRWMPEYTTFGTLEGGTRTNEKVLDFVQRFDLLPRYELLLAAASGGLDSMCLLDFLYENGYRVCAAHTTISCAGRRPTWTRTSCVRGAQRGVSRCASARAMWRPTPGRTA